MNTMEIRVQCKHQFRMASDIRVSSSPLSPSPSSSMPSLPSEIIFSHDRPVWRVHVSVCSTVHHNKNSNECYSLTKLHFIIFNFIFSRSCCYWLAEFHSIENIYYFKLLFPISAIRECTVLVMLMKRTLKHIQLGSLVFLSSCAFAVSRNWGGIFLLSDHIPSNSTKFPIHRWKRRKKLLIKRPNLISSIFSVVYIAV